MKTSELRFDYPESLVATEPKRPSRVMWSRGGNLRDLEWQHFLKEFGPGDLIVVNDTQVTPLRIWANSSDGSEADILFVREQPDHCWDVLAPFKKMKGLDWQLPGGVQVTEMLNGIPQRIRLSQKIDGQYFAKFGEVPLPPYILKARGDRHSVANDREWYRSIFAKDLDSLGSSAAPTASLHFSRHDFNQLRSQGVDFASLTLHVGLGTYLPVTAPDLDQHKMHFESVHIPIETWKKVSRWGATSESPRRVFALGTTVARALESAVIGKLKKGPEGFHGATDLLIQPGYDFKIVRSIMTNFHQPESTLLAFIAAFAGLERVKEAYSWAIERKFRLFSYGDLTVWQH